MQTFPLGCLNLRMMWQLAFPRAGDSRESKAKPQCLLWHSLRCQTLLFCNTLMVIWFSPSLLCTKEQYRHEYQHVRVIWGSPGGWLPQTDYFIITILQMRKQIHIHIYIYILMPKWCHTKWLRQDLNPHSLFPECVLLTDVRYCL